MQNRILLEIICVKEIIHNNILTRNKGSHDTKKPTVVILISLVPTKTPSVKIY